MTETEKHYKILDFHTHVFPDKIAAATIAHLESCCGNRAYLDGTLSGLRASMREGGIAASLVLPVVTKPSQFRTVNDYAASINGTEGVYSFGGIHPDSGQIREEIDYIASLGLKGIKLHPDYQGTFVEDPKYVRIVDYALEKGLLVIFHAGIDIGFPNPVHCSPEGVICLLRDLQAGKKEQAQIILAHTGGWKCWDKVEELLVDTDCWFDCSFSLDYIQPNQFKRIVENHGADKMLFGSDSPWDGQRKAANQLLALELGEEEEEAILWKNGAALLGIE